ncbi:GDSL esterase/lipase At2g27360-like [Coffea arabica]|uniref:GDSL esterase/lipase At2g27360-like n=1 Tax=Coffea arabica TaxID=13443 RepID=A0A6P6W2J0_COFAR|nr:GDSL esterase/lipase At2g27360-like [Coffea arabica]
MTTIMVPGMIPAGCLPQPLSFNRDHPSIAGCIGWLNELMIYHNDMLQKELNRIRDHHPHASIIYADYYNSTVQLYHSAQEYGFNGKNFVACCGGGGPYNYNFTAECGDPLTTSCPYPSVFVNWDGNHFTEAANRWMTRAILEGRYTFPQINTSCISSVDGDDGTHLSSG